MLSKKLTFEHLATGTSVSACILMASIYVGSLYLWRQENRFRRNEPSVIKRRFVSVILSCAVSLALLYVLGDDRTTTTTGGGATLAEWIGWHSPIAMLSSSLIALFLTAVLFLGPLVQLVLTQTDCNNNNNRQKCFFKKLRTNPMSTSLETLCELARRLQDPCFLRNYLISPFTEEFVFRSCMLPLVAPKLLARAAVLTTPLFFGVAHLHHIVEGVKTQSASLTQLLAQHLFQFTYTYIFGVYSSYLFVRTGCFLPTFVIHSFCNFMGFPLVDELVTSTSLHRAKRLFILFSYLAGFLLFFAILEPLTEPSLFHNHLYSAFIVKS